jgi:lysophospholipase L1-like esterase
MEHVQGRMSAILFGDSLTQRAFDQSSNGWGLSLASYWAAKVDVLNRGYSGYNTRWAGYMLKEIFGHLQADSPCLGTPFSHIYLLDSHILISHCVC